MVAYSFTKLAFEKADLVDGKRRAGLAYREPDTLRLAHAFHWHGFEQVILFFRSGTNIRPQPGHTPGSIGSRFLAFQRFSRARCLQRSEQ
jgi:hypothetical protein